MERIVEFDMHSTEARALNATHGIGTGANRSTNFIRLCSTRAEANL